MKALKLVVVFVELTGILIIVTMSARNRARLGSPLRLHGSFELFGQSAKLIGGNIWVFGPLFALPLLFAFHAWEWTPALGGDTGHHWTRYSWFGSGFSSSLPYYLWYAVIGSSILWFFFVLLAGSIVQIMLQRAQLEATEGKPLDFIRLWRDTKPMFIQMFGLYAVMGLYIVIGLALFIIPGLIFLRRYILAPYVMLDSRCDIKTAMERSDEITKPYAGYIFGMVFIMFLIGLLNALLGIGWMIAFFLGMFYSAVPALRYQELKHVHGGRNRPAEHEHSNPDIDINHN
jgi:hypothetical protein